ncbi:hypothetical protein DVF44_23195 [Salmonella enterica subsp. enterica serovar Schwarzengrund]|nr:hypothetical protein [Salmonella enterica subsp. enterica serovar Schwarzengrund]
MLMTFLSLFIGLAGAILLSAGAWLILPAAGLITGGLICLLWSFLIARSMSASVVKSGGE